MQETHSTAEGARAGGLGPALAGFVMGTALQLQQPALWPAWAYAVGLLPALLLAGSSGLRARGLGWLLCAALAMGFALTGLRAGAIAQRQLDPALEGRDLDVSGVVAAMPQRNEGGLRFRFEVESARLDQAPVSLPPQLYLGWWGGVSDGAASPERQPAELRAGERWQLRLRLKAPHGNLNPHGFDYELWLWEQGLQASGYVRAGPKDPPPQRLGETWRHPLERARQTVRDAIFARLGSAGSDEAPDAALRRAGVLAALVTGDQGAIDRADWDMFRATGVAHLMSISGLHITLFAWVAMAGVGALWRRTARWGWRCCLWLPAPQAALLGGVALATAYALFSGWGVPAQRTVWMLLAVSALRLTARQWPWPLVWLLACAVVVAIDPWALLQAGFWLSFVAVGVLFAARVEARGDEAADLDRPWSEAGSLSARAAAAAATLLREQWVVSLALTPLSLLLFGQVSLVGLLANLIAIPWVTWVLTPLALCGVLVPPLWDMAAAALRPLAAGLQWLAGLPFATLSTPAPALWAGAAGVAGGALLAMRLPWRLRVLGLPLLLPALLWQAPRPAAGQFELLAADVGQGNAVIVRTASHTLVYDAGPRFSAESDAGHRVLVPLLRALGERVDTLMLSHRDTDHTGGARAVLAMQPQAALTGSLAADHELQALRPASRCEAGQRWDWDGVRFELLHPQPGDEGLTQKSNALSCVLRIDNGRHAALLPGDIEAAQEARLVAAAAPLRADLLLVPHHGSKTSSTPAFLDAVQPRLALVQAGYRNRFGHPAAPVMGRYSERNIRVIQSAGCGAARWSSSAPGLVRCEREQAARYWHHRLPD
ncbi:DNA internalization-related competence protein ComEC/Rec2 [Ramlibacter sp. 2FC]|uniref:DNA internalization-related competence protein ComEC/Rec2 n=1 Tax=Ramlibacter sp. 2FC TaxID=2502188 RepID=UPI0010FA44B6|nr:DNA internalization-related competence protein ComEC/Rec2 [Ramlibacter sp. 2FC]